jgi:hypothetical protein
MKYEKPNVVLTALAVDAVKGMGKGDDLHTDSKTFVTEAAYEADE